MFRRSKENDVQASFFKQKFLKLHNERDFQVSLLTNNEGLPIVVAPEHDSQIPDTLAAVVTILERTVQRSLERSGISSAQEVVVSNLDGTRLVCRFFDVKENTFILACVVPDETVYRQVMNQMVAAFTKSILQNTGSLK